MLRKVQAIYKGESVTEGAGVHLRRGRSRFLNGILAPKAGCRYVGGKFRLRPSARLTPQRSAGTL